MLKKLVLMDMRQMPVGLWHWQGRWLARINFATTNCKTL
jgi:hypothetical protein